MLTDFINFCSSNDTLDSPNFLPSPLLMLLIDLMDTDRDNPLSRLVELSEIRDLCLLILLLISVAKGEVSTSSSNSFKSAII